MKDALKEFQALQRAKGPSCTNTLLDLSAEDRAALDEALASPAITSKAIERWVGVRGQTWRSFSINRHRRGDCLCGGQNNG